MFEFLREQTSGLFWPGDHQSPWQAWLEAGLSVEEFRVLL